MPQLMRCQFCGVLQDEPVGAKVCSRCGGELAFEAPPPPNERDSYIKVDMELDQVMAPIGQNVERHLLVTLRTPAQVPAAQAAQAQAGRPPLNFVAVLDVSGSMEGEKLARAKDALRHALARLVDGDVMSLVIFSTDVRCIFEPAIVNAESRKIILSVVQEITTHESTNLCGGLEVGIEQAQKMKRDTNFCLLLSDGLANVGVTAISEIGKRSQAARRQGVLVSSLGVGDDYNEALMVEIADQGGGRFYHVERAADISAFLTTELGDIANLAARDAQLALDTPLGALIMPFSSAYPVQQSGDKATISIGSIPCDMEIEIPVRVAFPAQTKPTKLGFTGVLTYNSPAGNRLQTSLNRVTVRFVQASEYHLRAGVVAPVVERVLTQLKAGNILDVSRTYRENPAAAPQEASKRRARVRDYATLLGDERAKKEADEIEENFQNLASPAAAKAAVAAAYTINRSARKQPK